MATLPDQLGDLALRQPDSIALSSPSNCVSWRELWREVTDLAQAITDCRVERVGLAGDNTPGWVIADLACLVAGVVCVPIPGFFSSEQTKHLKEQAGLDALLWVSQCPAGHDYHEKLSEHVWLEPLAGSERPASMPLATTRVTFTSGSTGQPKGVCLSSEHLTATVDALRQRLAGMHLSRHLCILPLATLLENIAGVYLPLTMGGTVVLEPLASLGMTGSSTLDAGRLIRTINRHNPDSMILVPELAAVLVSAAENGQLEAKGLRFLAVGGGKVSDDLLRRAKAIGLPLFEGYGLSECGSVVALNRPGEERSGTVGRPLGHVRVNVDSQGEIQVAGSRFLGYLGEEPGADGPVATGDLGSLDADGYLQVNGRIKNLLITSFGRNVSPEWLESELVQCIGVRQALVFGDGEPALSALLTIPDGRSAEQIADVLEELNRRLPDYARLLSVYIRRRPLTSQQGYLTDNGRLIRVRLMNDLPELLAGTESIHLHKRGNSMAFFDTLQAETAEARAHVNGAPVIRAIAEGRFDLKSYTWFLTQAYHHVKHTVPLMMACGSRLPERLEFVRKALVEYIEEEYGHHEWILDDLAACGEDREVAQQGSPDTSIELMVSWLYDQIHRGNPVAFFGMVQVLEGTSIELATPLAEQIQKHLALPDQAFSYLYSHGALDQDHFEFFRNLMNEVINPDDQVAIISAARMVYRLYGDMLWSIPLPAQEKDKRHEAA
ncbi:AMP-binding protein [Marinobacter sp.]|uniref:AMP-binding protein n=1 Tax=Marinobacter sp. TaxID=50741 RepID=UPI00384ABE44